MKSLDLHNKFDSGKGSSFILNCFCSHLTFKLGLPCDFAFYILTFCGSWMNLDWSVNRMALNWKMWQWFVLTTNMLFGLELLNSLIEPLKFHEHTN